MSIILPTPNICQPFKFWCQKALPLVYDDSLSYYEVLCKLTNYINSLRDDTVLLADNVTELNKLYNELKELVENYYNTGVQDNVNKKLDEMAESGYFENIISKYVTTNTPIYLNTAIEMVNTDLNENAKIFTSGYYKVNDGGACSYIIKNTGDSYSIQLNNGKYAYPIIRTTVYPEMFGAKGDGITDDTEPLQKALSYSITKGGNFKCCSNKKYIINKPLVINMFDIVNENRIYQYGKIFDFNNSIITSNNIIACAIDINIYMSNSNRHYTSIRNVNIDGNNETIHTGVWGRYLSCCDLTNITCNNVRRGILYSRGNESKISNVYCRRDSELDININNGWTDKLLNIFKNYANSVGYSYPTHQNIINDEGLINIEKTDCNGIEINVSDAFIDTAIIVDFLVSVNNWSGGDNHITKVHGWNYACEEQLKSCAIFINSGSNYYTNCTMDRFKYGMYVKYNVVTYISQCNFTNSAYNETDIRNSYAFYFSDRYAHFGNVSGIYCDNTRFAGDISTNATENLPILTLTNANVPIDLKNCTYYNVNRCMLPLNDKSISTIIKSDNYTNDYNSYGSLETLYKIIPLSDHSNFTDIAGTTIVAGNYIGSTKFFLNNLQVNSVVVSPDVNNSAVVTITPYLENSGTLQYFLNESEYDYSVGDIIIFSLKYKCNVETNFFLSSNLTYIGGLNNDAYDKNYITKIGEWNVYTVVCKINKIGNIINFNVGDGCELQITDLRIYNLKTNVKRYYLESNEQYAQRLINKFGTEMINITLTPSYNVGFISTTIPIEFIDVYKDMYNKYKIRYNITGNPLIYNNDRILRECYLSPYPNKEIFAYTVATGDTAIVDGESVMVYPKFEEANYREHTDIVNITNGTYGKLINPKPKLIENAYTSTKSLWQEFPARDNELLTKPYIYKICYISTNRYQTDVVSSTSQIIPLYNLGDVYLVYPNSENVDTLPTVYTEYTFTK